MKSKNPRGRAKPPHLYPKWTARQDDFARRYAVALVRGLYPDALAAARACQQEFTRKTGHWIGHRLEGVHIRIGWFARELGRPATSADWGSSGDTINDFGCPACLTHPTRSDMMVETMLNLHKDLPKVRTTSDKTVNSFQPTAYGSQLSNQHGTMKAK